MAGGSSGGAWIGDLTTPHAGGNYAIGLNSFHITDEPDNEWSLYFDSSVIKLYNYASGLEN